MKTPNSHTDHGELAPKDAPAAKRPRIPRSLRGQFFEWEGSDTSKMNHAESLRRYGAWRVRAEVAVSIYGTRIAAGDQATLPGNTAVLLASMGKISFIDPRLDDEERVAAEAAKLNIPTPARELPAFARH